MTFLVPLSKLVAGRSNPRRVKPERDAHRRLVASIRANQLLQPLVVRPFDDDRYQVMAGNRRLRALRVVHRGEDTKIPCVLMKVDGDTAREIGLAENFVREPMHPLDEAEAFARLASDQCKGVAAVATHFGVEQRYVRQRMKLALLAEPIKAAYRNDEIDTGTAEAFTVVSTERQLEVWNELNGHPRSAEQVRHLIAGEWIDAASALFDVATLDGNAVSRDLFSERVLVERSAFMEAQAEALLEKHRELLDDGWNDVVIGERAELIERMRAMTPAEPSYDEETLKKLSELQARRAQAEMDVEENVCGPEYYDPLLDAIDREEEELLASASLLFHEATKASGTVFLLLDADGSVHTEYCVPCVRREASPGAVASDDPERFAGSEALSDRQKAAVYTHEAIAVRDALGGNALVRKRLLVLALHEKVRTDALTIRRDVNGTTVRAESEEFHSEAFDAMQSNRAMIDPFTPYHSLDEEDAYAIVSELDEDQLDRLIDVLLVDTVSGDAQRQVSLIEQLRHELGVSVRDSWTPDAAWLSGYRKFQLSHLIGELRGPVHGSVSLARKKSELVDELATLFADAKAGRLDDSELADRVNGWLPSVLIDKEDDATVEVAA